MKPAERVEKAWEKWSNTKSWDEAYSLIQNKAILIALHRVFLSGYRAGRRAKKGRAKP